MDKNVVAYSTEMVIIVLTSNKRKENYLNQTLTSLHLEHSKATENFQIILCSADSDKLLYEENLGFKWIFPCLDGRCINLNSQSRRGNKHVEDFLICYNAIKSQLDFTSDIQLWIEDDVVLMENFFQTLSSILALRNPGLSTTP